MEYDFGALTRLKGLRFTFSIATWNRTDKNTPANIPLDMAPVAPPATLVRTFRVLALHSDGDRHEVARVENNYQRSCASHWTRLHVPCGLCLRPPGGAPDVHVFAWDVN